MLFFLNLIRVITPDWYIFNYHLLEIKHLRTSKIKRYALIRLENLQQTDHQPLMRLKGGLFITLGTKEMTI